jgi:integral membrane protein (TIGR00529 family)
MLNLIGVIIAFAIIIILIRRKINFGISLILGALVLGLFSLMVIEPVDIIKTIIEASIYSFESNQIYTQTIELALLMTLIYILAKLMQETGAITKLIKGLQKLFSKGGTLGVIPAIYGLMPVPGGALFSAPVIDEEGNKYKITKDQKNFLNVWFRHIWFAIFPMSSAMILICSREFSNIDIYLLVFVNIPAFIASILIGIFYIRKFVKINSIKQKNEKTNYSFLIYLLPPIVPIIFYIFFQLINFSQIRSFLIGIIISIIVLYFISNINLKNYLIIIKNSLNAKLALAIFGIMIFREMFEVSEASIILANGIINMSIPSIFIIILVPIILGMLTGYNLGSVALSYPLIEPFFVVSGINIVGITSIIFISSLVGYLISPIHLCNVVSSEYLKTDSTRMYKMYIPASIFILFVQVIFVLIVFSI